jgi:hypothetical protein
MRYSAGSSKLCVKPSSGPNGSVGAAVSRIAPPSWGARFGVHAHKVVPSLVNDRDLGSGSEQWLEVSNPWAVARLQRDVDAEKRRLLWIGILWTGMDSRPGSSIASMKPDRAAILHDVGYPSIMQHELS